MQPTTIAEILATVEKQDSIRQGLFALVEFYHASGEAMNMQVSVLAHIEMIEVSIAELKVKLIDVGTKLLIQEFSDSNPQAHEEDSRGNIIRQAIRRAEQVRLVRDKQQEAREMFLASLIS